LLLLLAIFFRWPCNKIKYVLPINLIRKQRKRLIRIYDAIIGITIQ